MADTVTFTIESDADDEPETIEVPEAAVEILGEGESGTTMAGDLVMLGMAQQLHATVFHTEETAQDRVKEANDALDSFFLDRFGMTYGEMADHDH